MEDNNLKNIIVLKNLPSNIVEEAIVVLKGNKIKASEKNTKGNEQKPKQKEYIIKEAEMVISNYLSTMESMKIKNEKKNSKIEKKYKALKAISIALGLVLISMIIF